ncbi:MAG TPA: C40 family peptidase [Gemmatimonadaceae bacterium]|nr:C40 family peptidase [Gemmatimonadaceae bacterium]
MTTLLAASIRRRVLRVCFGGTGVVASLMVAAPTAAAQRPHPRVTAATSIAPVVLARPAAPKPFARFSASMESLRDSIIVSVVRNQIGTRYVLGGTSPKSGFDCSGLVKYVMGALQVSLPRTAAQQARMGLALGRDSTRLRPGDLLTFGRTRDGTVSHIGIYVGNGRYVHASSKAGRVIESPLDRPASPLIRKWHGSQRVVAGTADAGPRGDS